MQEERADGLEVLDWIVGQPWSDGRVGLWGISYDAMCVGTLHLPPLSPSLSSSRSSSLSSSFLPLSLSWASRGPTAARASGASRTTPCAFWGGRFIFLLSLLLFSPISWGGSLHLPHLSHALLQ